ncbi:hypothetical protein SeJ_A1182 [Salmonella enterica subsp. enterica serovar Javiana str. GA_MM04042433]|nr:hypothetical protein SeJ_A1182 [Salmonella enterica subsp. enterica serovar Javiana str. GA_MM04042433]
MTSLASQNANQNCLPHNLIIIPIITNLNKNLQRLRPEK